MEKHLYSTPAGLALAFTLLVSTSLAVTVEASHDITIVRRLTLVITSLTRRNTNTSPHLVGGESCRMGSSFSLSMISLNHWE